MSFWLSLTKFAASLGKPVGEFLSKKIEARRKAGNRLELWQKLENRMPGLIAEMRTDWLKPKNRLIRSFFTLPKARENGLVTFADGPEKLVYFHEDHEQLEHKLTSLEEHGFVLLSQDEGAIKKYRATEEFVTLLIRKSESA